LIAASRKETKVVLDSPLALACLLLASKLEDVEPISLQHLLDRVNLSSPELVIRAERDILLTLQFKLINTDTCLYREAMKRYKAAQAKQMAADLMKLRLKEGEDAITFLCYISVYNQSLIQ
jgi:hypothetical protein